MCRFLAYKGVPLLINHLLYEPKNSLIHQSYHALERRDPVNGDGFGLGWYVPDGGPEPIRYLSVRPAWNDQNLQSIASGIRTECLFAHVRDASAGMVTELNCHPFQYGSLLMMHNGQIEDFKNIKRHLRGVLIQEAYDWLSGETDSEHFFALVLHHLISAGEAEYGHKALVEALQKAIKTLTSIFTECQPEKHFYLNLAITNGKSMIACRYETNQKTESPTLYYSSGSRFECRDGVCQMVESSTSEHSVLIVSEKLTDSKEDWHKVPEDSLVVVSDDLDVSVFPLNI